MFDIGFSELVLIGVIALIVIGPERLPEVARTVGKYVGRMRRLVNKVRDDIEREVNQEELREALKRHADLDDIKNIINDSRYTIENEVGETKKQVEKELEETRKHVVEAREDDPRGDFSQKDHLKEQDKEFENDDYGLIDHQDYAAEELDSLSAQAENTEAEEAKQAGRGTQTTQTTQAKTSAQSVEHTANAAKQDDGSNEKSNA